MTTSDFDFPACEESNLRPFVWLLTGRKCMVLNACVLLILWVFPGHFSGNTVSTTYTVGERGADIIKADDRYGLIRVGSAIR